MAASAGAWYRVGTVNVTKNNATVTGVGSSWQSDVIAIAIGDAFTIDAKTWYEVIAVDSDTSITLDRGFEGTTANGVDYAILRNTSGTILTRIAGQIAVQFNQKQLFLDELRNWLTSDDETTTLTDSHGISYAVKTLSKIQDITGTAATKDVTTSPTDTTAGRLLKVGDFGISGNTAPPFSNTLNYDSNEVYSGIHRITNASQITLPEGVSDFGILDVSRYGSPDLVQVYTPIPQDRRLFRRIQGDIVGDWVEMYHSGNSVNPLNYGLGATSASGNFSSYEDMDRGGFGFFGGTSEGNTTGFSISTLNLPTNVSSSSAKISLTHSANVVEMYIERVNGGAGLGMQKVLHDGNTNVNDFHSNNVSGALIAIGEVVSPSILRFYLPTNGIKRPTSLTVTSTFSAYRQGTLVEGATSGIALNAGLSSPKLTVVEISGENYTVGEPLNLRSATPNSSIKVNF